MIAAQPLFTDFAAAPRSGAHGVATATLIAPGQSGGRSRVDEVRAAAGSEVETFGDPLHHRYLYVLEGAWTIAIGGDPHAVSAGTALVAPRGAACGGFPGGGAGRVLILTFPG